MNGHHLSLFYDEKEKNVWPKARQITFRITNKERRTIENNHNNLSLSKAFMVVKEAGKGTTRMGGGRY